MASRPAPRRRVTEPKRIGVVERTHKLLDALYEQDVHAQRLAALKDGVLGVAESSSLNIHAIGVTGQPSPNAGLVELCQTARGADRCPVRLGF